uniref:Reverse transcriptase Ty1/copia-type domain-containing protein n=1 Tax=Solanum lycopersicum TaxID=4081 RepID=A0A3Q7ECF9_SOLLC
MYLTSTRPGFMFVVSLISHFMACPTQLYFAEAKRVLGYLKGDNKSTSGNVFMMSGGAISWSFRKQPIITLSTTEVEFFATAACACQAIWMRRILKEIGHVKAAGTKLICVNSSTTKLSKNPVLYGCSKNIRIRFHFLRDLAIEGVVNLL